MKTSAALVLAFLLGISGAKAQRAQLAMQLPKQTGVGVDVGAVAAGSRVQATLYLTPAKVRAAALDKFLADLGSTASPSYHRWLTPAQFGASFGADANQIDVVRAFVESQGLQVNEVSASGLSVTLSGTATQMEAAFAPQLHSFQLAGSLLMTNTAVPTVPDSLSSLVATVSGFDTLTEPSTSLLADGVQVASSDLLTSFAEAVAANASRVLALTTTSCAENIAAADATTFGFLAKEAAAQGMTVLATASCDRAGTVSFPGTIAEATAVALAPGLLQPAAPSVLLGRPSWQMATGLPADGLRYAPDVTVSSLAALSKTVQSILASLPAAADGSAARIGNMNPTLYALATRAGLYTQPDGSAPGTWEQGTGLGLVDLGALDKFYPRGTLSDNVSISATTYAPTHGQPVTLTSAVTDTSGQGNGAVPSGTITFTNSAGTVLGSSGLTNGSASLTLNTLPGGDNLITANYSGDGTYLPVQSVVAKVSVQREAASIKATVAGSVAVGGAISLTVTTTSTSGVDTPSGTISAQAQGTSNSSTYTATLQGSNGSSTATVQLPATQAGNIVILVSCSPSDANFSCYNSIQVNATVTQAASMTTLTVSPNPPVSGQTTTFTATVTGAASPAPLPTGNVGFYDNGVQLGVGTLINGTATYTTQSLSGTTSHTFTASYTGDKNYMASSANGTTANPTRGTTSTVLAITPNPPVAGSTTSLVATVAYTNAGSLLTGTVTFYEDGASIGTANVASNGTATFTSTIVSGATPHTFYAVYIGDTNYAPSTSISIQSQAGTGTAATSTTLSVTPTSPVKASLTTLTAQVTYASKSTPATGTVNFYEDSVVIGSGSVNAAGMATFGSTTIDGTSAHAFYAVYVGDANYQSSQSPTVNTQASSASGATTTTITAATMTPTSGVPTQFSATVTPTTIVSSTAPTGTVTFFSSLSGMLGSTQLVGSTAVLSVALTTLGKQTVTAVYNGDTNYLPSASNANPVSVTVGSSQATQTFTVTPPSPVPYGAPVTVTVSITGIAITGTGTLPAGTENFLVTPSTGAPGSLTGTNVALVATSATTSTATYTFAAGTPGTYVVQASCTGTNFQCSITPLTQQVVTIKANTTLVVTSIPTVPVAGQATTLTATIMPVAPSTNSANTYAGTVTFYDNGVSLGTGMLVGNLATFSTTLNSTTSHSITAVYSGDTNFNASTSVPVTLVAPPIVTTGTLTSNLGTALQQSNVIFTASISVSPTTTSPTPNAPYGTVTFYDLYNAQRVNLGTVTLVNNGPYLAVAQLSTTGLLTGAHSVTAVFSASTVFSGVTTNAVPVTITDYSLSFNPATMVLHPGGSGSSTLIISALSGFAGTVVLGCTPPSDASATCYFTPAQISGSGSSTLIITTTAPHEISHVAGFATTAFGVGFAAALGMLLVPRRRRPVILGLSVLCCLLGTSGCTVLNNTGATVTGVGTSGGTPLGTQLYTITTSGSDGVTTNRHDLQFQVTVQ